MNNQVFYKRDLPAARKSSAVLELLHVPKGHYNVACYRTGYRSNDPYATYLDLGSPSQLTRSQVAAIKAANSGEPFQQAVVSVGKDGRLQREFELRENDLLLFTFTRR